MQIIYRILILVALCCWIQIGNAQTKNIKKLFIAGNKALTKGSSSVDNTLSGDYSRNLKQDFIAQSISIWNEVLKEKPENPDANFKMGLSLYNTYDKKTKSLPYFIKATQKLKKNYSFNNDKGGASPFYSLFYLAEAYRLNNQPDSALKYYSVYRNKYKVPPISIEKEIFMSLNAKNSINKPRNVTVSQLRNINTQYAESNPVLKLDGKRLFFSSRRPPASLAIDAKKSNGRNSEDIYVAEKDASGKWGVAFPFPHNSEYDEVPLYVTSDGNTLYLRLSKNKNADIYVSNYKEGAWTKPESLKMVNSGFNENGICFSLDGKTLYFSSDMPGGTGGYDIYESHVNEKGKWTLPINLAFPINTSKNEISPNLTPDSKTLYYASNGVVDLGIGGYDLYFSEQKTDGKFKEPINMGYPINKSGDDFSLYNAADGQRLFAQNTPESSFDIFEITGGDFREEEVAANTEVVTITNEMTVAQVVETEKEVEKEVAIVEAIETQVEVEKEVEVTKEVEVEKIVEKEVLVADASIPPPAVEFTKEEAPAPQSNKINTKEMMGESPSKATQPETPKAEIGAESANIYYALNKTDIPMAAINDLFPFIEKLKELPMVTYQVIGHADRKGNWETNLKVSLKRAKKVRDFLVQGGIEASRVIYFGVGNLKAEADKPESSKDRRVEISILNEN